MPINGVGRSASSSRWASVAVVALALVLGIGYVQPQTADAATTNGAAKLSLPWSEGKSWRLTGGPHNHYGYSSKPWSSLDFAGPRAGRSYQVRAARGGVVSRPCRNLIEIRHGNGWSTSYYHVAYIRVRKGQRVARGQLLGYTSTRSGCGGSATGPHLHFSLKRYGRHVNINGHTIGGWTARDGSTPYRGCLVKGSKKRCAPDGSVYNTGAIGTR